MGRDREREGGKEGDRDTETRRQERVWEIQKKSEMGADTLRRNMARDQGGRGGKERIREEKEWGGSTQGYPGTADKSKKRFPFHTPILRDDESRCEGSGEREDKEEMTWALAWLAVNLQMGRQTRSRTWEVLVNYLYCSVPRPLKGTFPDVI